MSALRQMASAMAAKGRYGDRHLVHVNDRELSEMRDRWGEPTTHPETGLPEFFDLGGIGSLISGLAQIAGAVIPAVTGNKGAVGSTQYTLPTGAGVRNQQTGQYNMAQTSPVAQQGVLARLLGGSGANVGQNLLPAAAMAALDYFSQPKVPSVADQLAEINAAEAKTNPYWATPLPEVNYSRTANAAPSAGYDYGANPEYNFFSDNAVPTVKKKAFGGGIHEPGIRPMGMPGILSGMRRPMPTRSRGVGPIDGGMNPQMLTPPIMAEGGVPEMRAAGRMYHGPGSGQSDSIPAMLSNNEYVIDAGTVSDLGDGDPDAGASKLDGLRDAVAKQKGRRKRVQPKAHGNIARYLRAA